MLYDDLADSLRAGSFLARMLDQLTNDAPSETLRVLATQYFQADATWTGFIENGLVPRWGYARSQNGILILFCGCDNYYQAFGVMQGYGEGGRRVNPFGIHPFAEQIFQSFVPSIDLLVQPDAGQHITLAGHSMGGILANAMGVYSYARSRNGRVKIITYGAPKATETSSTTDWSEVIQYCRFMNVDDPIPFVPPSYAQSASSFAALSAAYVLSASRWIHLGQGRIVAANGTTAQGEFPPEGALPVYGSLLGWATGLLQTQVGAHSISAYASRLASYYPAVIDLQTPPDGDPSLNLPTHTNPFPVTRQMLLDRDAQQNPRVAALATVPRDDPRFRPYYAAKQNGVWYCWYQGIPLVSAKGRKEAAKVARDYNFIVTQWLRAQDGSQFEVLASLENELPQS